jgi:hypothetical protein
MHGNVLQSILLFFEDRSALSLEDIVNSVSGVTSTYKKINVEQTVNLLNDIHCFEEVNIQQ